jgi:hypothetical protein
MFSSSSPTLPLPLPCLLRPSPAGAPLPPFTEAPLLPSPRSRRTADEPLTPSPDLHFLTLRQQSSAALSLPTSGGGGRIQITERGRLPCARFGSRRGGRGRSGRSTGGGGSRRGGGGARARRCGASRQSSSHQARCERGRWAATAELHPLPLFCGGWLCGGTLRGGLDGGKRGRRKECVTPRVFAHCHFELITHLIMSLNHLDDHRSTLVKTLAQNPSYSLNLCWGIQENTSPSKRRSLTAFSKYVFQEQGIRESKKSGTCEVSNSQMCRVREP